MSKKVLILGAQGMLGHVAVKVFEQNGYDVHGIALTKFAKNITALDVMSADFDRFLFINKYDVVVNCIGILNQFAESNPACAIYLNSYLPHKLEQFYSNTSTKLIQPSTDCVFAGNTGPYCENSLPDGRTFYDRSKALGEVVNEKDVTLRMSIVGPDMNAAGIGLLNWFLRQKGEITGYKNAIWTGITTIELATGMVSACEENLTGLYHYVPSCSISKYDMLCMFAKIFNKDDVTIIPKDEPHIDKTLINTRTDFSKIIPGYEEMFTSMKKWVDEHPDLYPHYKKV